VRHDPGDSAVARYQWSTGVAAGWYHVGLEPFLTDSADDAAANAKFEQRLPKVVRRSHGVTNQVELLPNYDICRRKQRFPHLQGPVEAHKCNVVAGCHGEGPNSVPAAMNVSRRIDSDLENVIGGDNGLAIPKQKAGSY